MDHLMLDTDQLRSFLAIVDTGSFTRAAELLIAGAMAQLKAAFSELWAGPPAAPAGGSESPAGAPTGAGTDLLSYFERVEKALIDDWEDLVDFAGNEGGEDRDGADDGGSDPRDDPEHATRLNRFKVNLFVSR